MAGWTIDLDDPRRADVRTLLERHVAFAKEVTPPDDVHALDLDALLAPGVAFFSLREGGALLGVGALRDLGDGHAEIKSMHTAVEARGRGVARALLAHLLAVAAAGGCRRVSLETGTMPAFAPARALYAVAGFVPCGRFGGYAESPNTAFMTLELDPPQCGREESNLQEPKPTGT